jgi:hypothetical protein
MKVSEWLPVPDSECFMRVIEGTDPSVVANRVAFIEKTPRVRVKPWTEEDDWKNWQQGPKGGLDYGKDNNSRVWCNHRLPELGYQIPDLTRESLTYTNTEDDLDYVDLEVCATLGKNGLNSNNYKETKPEVCLLCKNMY